MYINQNTIQKTNNLNFKSLLYKTAKYSGNISTLIYFSHPYPTLAHIVDAVVSSQVLLLTQK